MKLKTDSTHKNFFVKSATSNKVKSIALKVGISTVIIGMVMSMSGCTKVKNEFIKKVYQVEADNTKIIQMYYDDCLSEYEDLEMLDTAFSPIDEDFINNLPPYLKKLKLNYNPFITDLSMLPSVCPNLEELYISDCYSITDFSFVKELKNLKKLYISDTVGITQELIDYLDEVNIEHNLSQKHIDLDNQIQDILDSIISEDMSDEEKVQQIALYVIKNMKYDITGVQKYNEAPLEYALKGKGVCMNYAVLTNALCTKAGLYSTVAMDNDHAWNLIKIENKYYYIDTTNIKQIPVISNLLLKYANIGFFYKQDPYATSLSVMSDVDDLYMEAPQRLLKLIEEANDEKNFIEKYGSNLYIDIIVIASILSGLSLVKRYIKNKSY